MKSYCKNTLYFIRCTLYLIRHIFAIQKHSLRKIKKNIKQFPDTELLIQYKKSKNNKYIGILFERYGHLVYGVCLKYLKNVQESQDATSLIFEKVMADLLRMEVKNFKSWLYMVSKNHCLMQLRKKNSLETENISELEYKLEDKHDSEYVFIKESQLKNLEEAIKSLKEEQQQCIDLFYLKEKTYDEVANLTGYETKKVKSYIQNGKRNLKMILTENHT